MVETVGNEQCSEISGCRSFGILVLFSRKSLFKDLQAYQKTCIRKFLNTANSREFQPWLCFILWISEIMPCEHYEHTPKVKYVTLPKIALQLLVVGRKVFTCLFKPSRLLTYLHWFGTTFHNTCYFWKRMLACLVCFLKHWL